MTKRKKEKKNSISSKKVWLITSFFLISFISGGFFFYQFMQNYSFKTYLTKAKSCYLEKDYKGASLNLTLAEEFGPDKVELLEFKADLFISYFERPKKAIDFYTLAIDQENDDKGYLLFKRAKAYQKDNQLELCKNDLLEASKSKIDSVNLYLAELANYNDHDYPLAIQYYLKENESIKDSYVLNFGLGFAYYNTRDFDLAITSFNKALVLMPNSGESYYFRGLSYNSVNEQKKACQDYQKAIEQGYSTAYVSYQALCN